MDGICWTPYLPNDGRVGTAMGPCQWLRSGRGIAGGDCDLVGGVEPPEEATNLVFPPKMAISSASLRSTFPEEEDPEKGIEGPGAGILCCLIALSCIASRTGYPHHLVITSCTSKGGSLLVLLLHDC